MAASSDVGGVRRLARRTRRVVGRTRRRARQVVHRARGWTDRESAERWDRGDHPDLRRSELGSRFLDHRGRLVDKWLHYFPAYDRHFAPWRDGFVLPDGSRRPLRLLEIGVYHGGSLQLWRNYFGPDAVIAGVDIDPRCETIDDHDLMIRIGSQADPAFLRRVVEEMGGVDLVLDDGSHHAAHQRISFDTLYPLLSEGGLYVVEDLHTSYWTRYGGGLGRRGAFVEVAKQMVDDVNSWAHGHAPVVLPAGTSASEISFSDSMVVIRKAPPSVPRRDTRGTPSF